MNIHEYQAKELLAKWGVAVARGIAAFSVDEAVRAVPHRAQVEGEQKNSLPAHGHLKKPCNSPRAVLADLDPPPNLRWLPHTK